MGRSSLHIILIVIISIGLFFTVKSIGSDGVATKLAGGLDAASSESGKFLDSLNDSINKNLPKKDPDPSQPTGKYDYLTFYEPLGEAKEYKTLKDGQIIYENLDSKGRAVGVYAKVTRKMYLDSKRNGREPITDDPTGWKHNKEVTISYDDPTNPENSKIYHGWFYNRSHLLADSLGGHPEMDNMVTGTRMQNVGWNDGNGGMAYLETKVRDFLKNPKNKNCSVYYSAVPHYTDGDDLIPQIVVVDAKSCDNTINEKVAVYNVAPGYAIDYKSGEFKEYEPQEQ